METEILPETSVSTCSQLTRLCGREDFTEFSRCERLKLYNSLTTARNYLSIYLQLPSISGHHVHHLVLGDVPCRIDEEIFIKTLKNSEKTNEWHNLLVLSLCLQRTFYL
jgi:hypothetical protein